MQKLLFIFIFSTFIINSEFLLFDFDSPESLDTWYTINDDVMGGVSNSQIAYNTNGTITFNGTLSPDNYGGFASIRSNVSFDKKQQFKGVQIRIKGDGNIYSLRFRTNDNFDSYAYQAKMQSKKDEWMEIKIPFNEFKATFRGQRLWNKPELISKNIAQIGILIADKQFGNFTSEIDWIKLYK